MTFNNRLTGLFLISLCFVLNIGCRGKDISDLARIGVKLSDSLLLESEQIIPYKGGFFVIYDIAKETGNFQMFIMYLDSKLTLISTAPFQSFKIDSIFNDTIYSVKSDNIGKPFFSSENSMSSRFIIKHTTDSKHASGGFNVASKLVSKVKYDYFTNKLWFYFFKSDSLTIGVAVNKVNFIDTSFARQFTIYDSLSIAPEDITIEYRNSVFVLRYFNKSSLWVREQLLVPRDSIWRNYLLSLKKE